VFIDSWSQKKPHDQDPTEQLYFMNETQKLWDFASSKPDFKFRNIDEVIDENEKLQKEIEELTSKNEELVNENAQLQNETESLKDKNYLLQRDMDSLQEDYDDLEDENDELKEKIVSLNGEIYELNDGIDDWFKLSVVRGVYVDVGDNGCNFCEMDITINSNKGDSCTVNDLSSGKDDWWNNREYLYYLDQLDTCDGFIADGGVASMTIQHHDKGGVEIQKWRVLTDSGSFLCNDGKTYDNSDNAVVTCVRENNPSLVANTFNNWQNKTNE